MKSPQSTQLEPYELAHLERAIELSRQGSEGGAGGPFGAVVARGIEVLGEGYNRVTSTNDPTAHAEVVAIRDACQRVESFDLAGCVIYSSCEPCPMCLSAIYWSRISHLVYANTRDDAASIGFDDAMIYEQVALPLGEQTLLARRVEVASAREVFDAWDGDPEKVRY